MNNSLAILLRKRVFREHDYLLTFYTKEYGKLTLLGRGMQKVTSKLAAHCADFFIITQLQWVHGARFDTLTSAQMEHQFEEIVGDVLRIGIGCQALEAVDQWTREGVPEPQLWSALIEVLRYIDTVPDPWVVVQAFRVRALSLLGWSLSLDQCLHCRAPFTVGARLSVGSGGGWCERCRTLHTGSDIGQNDLVVLKYLQSDQWGSVSSVQLQPLLSIIHQSTDLHRESPWSTDQWLNWVGRKLYARP